MSETFSELLEGIADEGRDRMRPFPATSIRALGHARRRRAQFIAAAATGLAACVAVGAIVLGTGGSNHSAPLPPTDTSSPETQASTPAKSEPSTAPSDTTPPAAEKHYPGYLTAAQLPFNKNVNGTSQWAQPVGPPDTPAPDPGVPTDLCSADTSISTPDPAPLTVTWNSLAPSADGTGLFASEMIQIFKNAGAARTTYTASRRITTIPSCHFHELAAGPDVTRTFKVGVTNADGYSVVMTDKDQSNAGTATVNDHSHMYVAIKGSQIAVLTLTSTVDDIADTSGDAAVLNAMASHLP